MGKQFESQKPSLFTAVPHTTAESLRVRPVDNTWKIFRLKQMTTEERELQKAENYRQILENYYEFLASVGATGINKNEGEIDFGYNGFLCYWEMQKEIATLENKPEFVDRLEQLKSNFEGFCYSIFFHDLIDHLDHGQNQKTNLSDQSDPIAENKTLTTFSSRFVDSVLFIDENKYTKEKNHISEAIDLLPQNEKDKLLKILFKKYSGDIERIKSIDKEFEKPENIAIIKNILDLLR